MSTGRICWGAMTSFLGRRSKRPRRHLGSSDNRPCDGSISACQGRLLAAQCVPNHADRSFEPPSRKIEFYSLRADKLGLPPLPVHKVDKDPSYPLTLSFGRTLTHFHAFYDEGRALPSLAKHKAAPQPWISRVDAPISVDRSGQGLGTDDVPPGAVWTRDGWVGLNRLTSGNAVLTGDALSLFPFSVGQSGYGVKVEVARA